MYSIVLTNGKIINVNATQVDWCEKERMVRLLDDRHLVARINMDNVVGWIKADNMVESEDTHEGDNRCSSQNNMSVL